MKEFCKNILFKLARQNQTLLVYDASFFSIASVINRLFSFVLVLCLVVFSFMPEMFYKILVFKLILVLILFHILYFVNSLILVLGVFMCIFLNPVCIYIMVTCFLTFLFIKLSNA